MKMMHKGLRFYSYKLVELFLLVVFCIMLSSCAVDSKNSLYKKLSKEDPKNVQYQGHYKIGQEYTVRGRTYKPIQAHANMCSPEITFTKPCESYQPEQQ